MNYPPVGHPAWETFCIEGAPHIPSEPGTYWYDQCWGSANGENSTPIQITIDIHEEGMKLTAINGEPEHTGRAMAGYSGHWAPLEWEGIKPVEVEAEEDDGPNYEAA